MQKMIVFMLIVVLLMASFLLADVSASGCDIELSAAQNVEGFVDVTVSIKSNPGMISFLLKIHFDNKKLSPNSVMRGSVLPISGTLSNNLSGTDFSKLNYVQVYFVNASSFTNITADGTLFTIRFKINDNANGRVVFYIDNTCEVIKQSEANVPYTPDTEQFTITKSPVEIMFTQTNLSVSDSVWNGNVNGLISETTPVIQEDNAVILTAYDSSHKLIYERVETVKSLSVVSGQPFTISDITIPAKQDQPLHLKLFIWNSVEHMEPLAEDDARIVTIPKKGGQ